VGWYVDYGTPFYLIANPEDVDRLKRELYAIGVDNVMGYFTPDVISGNTVQLPQMTAAELHQRMSDVRILDVRGRKEYEEVRIAGAKNIPMGYIVDRINEIPREGTLVTHCAGGLRSQVAASVLKKHGFDNVVNLEGGIDAWQAEGLPVEKDALESAVTA
jgi:hydroxyacylglutathione hydrolase